MFIECNIIISQIKKKQHSTEGLALRIVPHMTVVLPPGNGSFPGRGHRACIFFVMN